MDELFWLAVLLLLVALPVAAIVIALRASWRIDRLSRRLDRLASEQRRRPAAAEPPAAVPEAPAPVPPEPLTAPPSGPKPAEPPAGGTPEPPRPSPAVPPIPAPRRPSLALSARELEQRLGARLPVWLGAIALVLSAAFLVKLSFDRGWLGPPVRVALGVAFGIVLLAAGERFRRGAARIAQGLAAAGVAVLFVSFYAAVNLYALVPALAGFGLMALTTAVAVALSLRHGAMVAVLGLVGGFLTPYLVTTGEPDPRVLFFYLLLLQAGLLAVSRRRGWWPLAVASFLGGLVWIYFWLDELFRRPDEPWLGLFVLASAALFTGAGVRSAAAGADPARARELTWLGGAGGLAAMTALTWRGGVDLVPWLFLALLGAGTLVLARRAPGFHWLACFAAAAPALLLARWAGDLTAGQSGRFLGIALGMGLLHAAGAYLALWRSPEARRWGWLSAASGLAYLLVAYWGGETAGRELPWGAVCLALALAYLAAALPVARRRRRSDEMASALAALAVAVTSFVSLAVPIELQRAWLSVAWALEVVALVWLAGRLKLPILVRLAWVVAAAVAVRLLLNPAVLSYPIGEHPLLNWLLYGYGIPLAAFAGAAALARRQALEHLSEALEWGALGIATVLAALLVRQAFHPGELDAGRFPLLEWGTLTVVWLTLAWALLLAVRRWPLRSLSWFGQGLALVALAQAVLCQVLAANPIWSHQTVGGWPVINDLLWVYGAPALLLALIARELRGRALPVVRATSMLGALGLTFLLVTLEVRQAFRGSHLDQGTASGAEQYAYSAAWIALGLALLAGGIASRGRLLRFASLAVMLVAVGKVFLFDLAELRDFYRVFSFLGLGLSLLLIAWLYQRFVFREAPEEADGS